MIYDVLIVGGGPIGIACAIEAQKTGLNYVVIEKGCLVNSLYHYPVNMTFFSTSERLEIGEIPFMSLNAKPNRAEALEYYRRVVVHFGLNIHFFEKVLGIKYSTNSDAIEYLVETDKLIYSAKKIIIATGFYDLPVLLNVPGEDLPKVSHYYKDPAYYAFQKVLVVGGNNSAVDAALECWRKGANVTIVIREGEIGKRVKYWARPDMVNRIEEGNIKAYFNSSVATIGNQIVQIKTPNGLIEIENDFVLAMTGYQPNFAFLSTIGIQLSPDCKKYPKHNLETMETNLQGIYLAGVVCGGMDTHVWFIENSREHAKKILRHIQSQ